MRSLLFRCGLTTAAVVIAVSPALAQKPGESGGSPAAERPVAVERPAAGGGDSGARTVPAASSSGGSAAANATTSSSPSATSIPTMGFGGSRAAYREEAPQHRTSGGSASSGQAVPRSSAGGSASSSSSSGAKSSPPARGQAGENHSGSQAVPDWARPRGGQPTTGTAVERTTPRPSDNHGHYYNNYYYNPFGYYYGPSSYYYGNYLYGGAYLYPPYYYAPYWASPYIYSPYMLGYGLGLGFPWGVDPSYGAGYGADNSWYGGSGGGNYSSSQPVHDEEQGGLRLKVKPRDAKVYVDGYFVGTVDSMDGVFQKVPLNSGRHHVAVKADGYQPEEFEVVISPNETATYQGDLKKSKF